MLAIRHHSFGPPDVLHPEHVADPEPGAGELRIAVEAAGIHLLDTTIRSGADGGPAPLPELPTIPGREVAGIVDAVGDGVPDTWLGRRVVAHLGAGRGGGSAELAVVAAARAYEIPDGLDAAVAVAAIGTGRTATGILDLAELQAGEVAVVTSAAGGLGVLLVQAVAGVGGTAVGLARGERKLAVAREAGAAVVVDYTRPDWDDVVRQLAPPPTVVFDAVGGDVGRRAYALLAPGGRLVRYGWTSGEQTAYDDADRRVVDVLGPAMVAREGGLASLESEALARAADGTRVPLVGSTFPLADAADAHRALEARETHGKVVLLTPRAS
ncbi:Alcohol dehydrogenase zinc-binding domain protein [Beutenbergia cavernae DSM 12333]|uniref:Alcohol dehydrogenase zinc-binding domain protein n=1 Tax=Beutenbergia cavernae (strain ATCC BAA-8 / DSM 12333 / CCUG 43141 / JCM 11478 / NBRC 16432 / NCIMB 13614 / HKI 0122) TaxID=471853 RepID=C5C5W9_BEUC1|nr:zinc-binding dehydrogenase [Beutenbergia cavernae]ACQ82327.1 Alcohol dehydrogenase zinc-binding domain protein [Beutenbergia cavernae DSM 12333]